MKKKVVIALLLGTLLISGCKNADKEPLMKEKKETIIDMYNALQVNYNNLVEEYDGLTGKVDNLKNSGELNPGITRVGDGSGKLTLNSVNNMVQFDKPLEYPNSTSVSTSSKVYITTTSSIEVRDNWVLSLKNSQLEMQHTNGISGEINVSQVENVGEIESIKDELLTPWVNQMTQDNIEYTDIFVGSDIWGSQAKFSTLINEKPARIQAGLFTYGDSAVTYVFVYDGDKDTTKDEIIKNVLNTLSIYDTEVITE